MGMEGTRRDEITWARIGLRLEYYIGVGSGEIGCITGDVGEKPGMRSEGTRVKRDLRGMIVLNRACR